MRIKTLSISLYEREKLYPGYLFPTRLDSRFRGNDDQDRVFKRGFTPLFFSPPFLRQAQDRLFGKGRGIKGDRFGRGNHLLTRLKHGAIIPRTSM